MNAALSRGNARRFTALLAIACVLSLVATIAADGLVHDTMRAIENEKERTAKIRATLDRMNQRLSQLTSLNLALPTSTSSAAPLAPDVPPTGIVASKKLQSVKTCQAFCAQGCAYVRKRAASTDDNPTVDFYCTSSTCIASCQYLSNKQIMDEQMQRQIGYDPFGRVKPKK